MRNYFITIKVNGHHHGFGTITDKKMKLSGNGKIALEQWNWLGDRYPYIDLISFVIMPDHVHGIIHINTNYYIDHVNPFNPVPVFSKIKPLPELIGAYKTTVSKRIHMGGDLGFKWQNSFHDHIIRNKHELNRIKCYIEKNPENWDCSCREGSRPFPTQF
jgi:REP element-mobilizing transposase RayT